MNEPIFKKYITNINNLLKSGKFCISKPLQLKKVYLKIHPDKTTKYSIDTQHLATELFKKLQQKEAIYYQTLPCNIDLDIYNKIKTPAYTPPQYKSPLSKTSPPYKYQSFSSPIMRSKKCPSGKILNPKTNRCINDKTKKNKTKKNNSPSKTYKKYCPEGKMRNPKTGRCINDKTKKYCPEGKMRNPKTGRCNNNKTTKK
jgi:hypothetical protein